MKKSSFLPFVAVLVILTIGLHSLASAQLRKDLDNSSELMGPVIKQNPSEGSNLGNLFNMQMDHSYSMMFSSFGGQMQNMNAYTNTMHFFFSDKLTGRVDVSLLHSPFGNSFMPNNNGTGNGMNTEFILRNAELNYQISDKSNISIQVQQLPNHYGMNPWGMGHQRYNPFYSRHNILD